MSTFERIADFDAEREADIAKHLARLRNKWDSLDFGPTWSARSAFAFGYAFGVIASCDQSDPVAAYEAYSRWIDEHGASGAARGDADSLTAGDDSSSGAGVPGDAAHG